jgi:FKBP-type peptidyl-prolyl cis-trans isomerase 2
LDLTVGSGEECCAEGKGVVVDWTLRRSNGYFVDASFGFDQSRGIDERFGVGQTPDLRFVPVGGKKDEVIEGVREAVQGMRVGGTRRVIVPPALAWAKNQDVPPVPLDWGRKRQIQRFKDQSFIIELRLKAVRE